MYTYYHATMAVMRMIVQKLLDFIFPPRNEELCVRSLSLIELTDHYACIHTNNTYALLPFTEPIVSALIHEAKFWHNARAQQLLAAILELHLEKLPPARYLLVPIPLSRQRYKKRGYNQVHEILRAQHTYSTQQLLTRTRHTVPQTDLSRSDRLHNMKDAFTCTSLRTLQHLPATTHLILIDDVTTTGATLQAAKIAMQQCTNLPITCIALAH